MADSPDDAIRRCVGDPHAFVREVWSRRPHRYAGADPGAYADVLQLADVDEAVGTGGLRHPSLRIVRAGESVARSSYTTSHRTGGKRVTDAVDPAGALRAFENGATLVLQAVHRFHGPVQAFCDSLESFFGHPLQANAYLTPPGARGLAVHHDTHDVLVLQLHGTKRWFLYEVDVPDPVAAHPRDKRHRDPGSPTRELVLAPGDCLYLPRGVPHHAEGREGASLHLTLGIRSPTWLDVMQRVLEGIPTIPLLRRPLPIAYATHPGALEAGAADAIAAVAAWLETVNPAAVAAGEVERARSARRPAHRGRLAAIAGATAIDDTTLLHRASEVPWRVEVEGEHALLCAGEATLRFPRRVLGALSALERAATLRPADLSATLDQPGRLVLARRLVREGFFRVAPR